MAIYRRGISAEDELKKTTQNTRASGLGRGFESLSGDNEPEPKKPLVIRRGACSQEEERNRPLAKPRSSAPKRTAGPSDAGGRLVIRADQLPEKPIASARSARRGTTVLVRTEREDPPRRYRVNEHAARENEDGIRAGAPIVINPRKKK